MKIFIFQCRFRKTLLESALFCYQMRKSLFLDHNSTPIQNNNKKFYSTKATILKNRTILRFYAQMCVFTHNCASFASGPDCRGLLIVILHMLASNLIINCPRAIAPFLERFRRPQAMYKNKQKLKV